MLSLVLQAILVTATAVSPGDFFHMIHHRHHLNGYKRTRDGTVLLL
jgi:hypothetical protein